MENKMIRFVLWSVVIMCLLAFTALAVWAADVSITASGSGNTPEIAYQQARAGLNTVCQGGIVQDVHTDTTSEEETYGVKTYDITLGATCHFSN